MKWQISRLSIFFTLSILAACSDSNNEDPVPASTQASSTVSVAPATETLKSDAKVKRSDATAKRLKDNVQTMTETIHPDEKTQKFSLKQIFKYDKDGNQVELNEYSPDGALISSVRSIYDSTGKIVSDETVLASGEIAFKSIIRTDDNGNKVEEDIKQGKGNNQLGNRKYIYKYDEEAHMLEWLALKGNGGFFFKYSFNYDDKGNRTEWYRLTEGNLPLGKTVYKYDDNKNIIEETKYDGNGNVQDVFTYVYEFDKKGNWIRQKKIKDGSVVEFRKREYKYF